MKKKNYIFGKMKIFPFMWVKIFPLQTVITTIYSFMVITTIYSFINAIAMCNFIGPISKRIMLEIQTILQKNLQTANVVSDY